MYIVIDNLVLHYIQFHHNTTHNSSISHHSNILLLHGWGQSALDWQQLASQLPLKVTVLDLPGFGRSQDLKHVLDIFAYSEIVAAVMYKLSLNNCIIIGHSFGGRIATILAAQQYYLCKKIILIAPGGIEIKNIEIRTKILWFKLLKPLKKLLPIFTIVNGSNDYRKISGILRTSFIKIINQDLRYLFQYIDIPVVVIWGNLDEVLPVRYTKIYKTSIRNAIVHIVWGCGHNPHLTHSHELLSMIKDEII